MTQVEYVPDKCYMVMSGHSGYAPAGQDIVCAAASILMWTLIAGLQDDRYHTHQIIDEGIPYMEVICEPNDEDVEKVKELFGLFWQGIELLQEKFPQYVRAEIKF